MLPDVGEPTDFRCCEYAQSREPEESSNESGQPGESRQPYASLLTVTDTGEFLDMLRNGCIEFRLACTEYVRNIVPYSFDVDPLLRLLPVHFRVDAVACSVC